MKYLRVAVLLGVAMLLAFATSTASGEDAGQGGGGGSPPATPKVPPNLPGEQRATFEVVLEGSSQAGRVYDLAGPWGGCQVTLHADIAEHVSFGLRRGVTIDVIRFRKNGHRRYVLQRTSRSGGSSVTVQAKVRRDASGSGQLVQSDHQPLCTPETDDLSRWPGCGQELSDSVTWALRIEKDRIAPRPRAGSSITGSDRCGEPPSGSEFSSDIGHLSYAWPAPAPLPFRKLPLHRIFGKTHAFELGFKSRTLEKRGSTGAAPLTGAFDDHGSAEATLRFVRR